MHVLNIRYQLLESWRVSSLVTAMTDSKFSSYSPSPGDQADSAITTKGAVDAAQIGMHFNMKVLFTTLLSLRMVVWKIGIIFVLSITCFHCR